MQGEAYTPEEQNALMNLMIDCDRYGITKEKDMMEYIEPRFKRIGRDTLYKYKKLALERADFTDAWLQYYSKAGFAINHHKLMIGMQESLQDTENLLRLEREKELALRDEEFIIKLKYLHMEQIEKFKKLALQTPVTAEAFEIFKKYRKENPEADELPTQGTLDEQNRGPDQKPREKFQLFRKPG